MQCPCIKIIGDAGFILQRSNKLYPQYKYYFSPPKNNKSRVLTLAPSVVPLAEAETERRSSENQGGMGRNRPCVHQSHRAVSPIERYMTASSPL